MLAKFVVDSHFRLQAKGASLDEKSFTDSQDDDRVTMAAFDPEIIPQELIKKYLTYAKLNVFPKLHDAYLDKLTQVYVEPRRESSTTCYSRRRGYGNSRLSEFIYINSEIWGAKGIGKDTAFEAWMAFSNTFGISNSARRVQLHITLQNMTLGDKPLAQFLREAKAIADELAAAGTPNSGKPISVVANVARQHTSSNQSLQANNGYKNNGASSTGNKKWFPTPCQICGLNNHQAKWCRKRYNRDNITANATKVNVSSNDWFLDTAASHHMTPDLSALEISEEYKGWLLIVASNDLTGQTKVFKFVRTAAPDWHARLDHPQQSTVSFIVNKFCLPSNSIKSSSLCEVCCLGKHCQISLPITGSIASKQLELIHGDVWGPAPNLSFYGEYFVLFVDDFSRYCTPPTQFNSTPWLTLLASIPPSNSIVPSSSSASQDPVFRLKHHLDGTIEHCKDRLVAKGYNQVEGIDYDATFSPLIKPTIVRVVLSLAISNQWILQQLDISNAFLNGTLEEDVHVSTSRLY
ncbi:hypothetical protein T459_12039 [Capsicum annuum]|uniref:Reverse transcriptase Ty1/copia-type domain-containing protein n=1 Tax=Capsicum annuum TaxID=4072 RepID=A0A2G2ZNM9_CAPAN|nr:hypothetical protein T459_12039 [Capsicum annuum]